MVEIWLVRHGETEWSRSGRHTGNTDLPLTQRGEELARALRPVLQPQAFDQVLASPLQRARRTAELAGFPSAETDADLHEWDYGEYEGITSAEIHEQDPDWSIWTDGCPGGESASQVRARVERVLGRCRAADGRSLLFAHGHVLRSLAAAWIEQPVPVGAHLPLNTAGVSVLGVDRGIPTLERWNSDR